MFIQSRKGFKLQASSKLVINCIQAIFQRKKASGYRTLPSKSALYKSALFLEKLEKPISAKDQGGSKEKMPFLTIKVPFSVRSVPFRILVLPLLNYLHDSVFSLFFFFISFKMCKIHIFKNVFVLEILYFSRLFQHSRHVRNPKIFWIRKGGLQHPP